jgi:hypothetical protein
VAIEGTISHFGLAGRRAAPAIWWLGAFCRSYAVKDDNLGDVAQGDFENM